MLKNVIRIPNGDIWARFDIYECDMCGEEIPENHPHHKDGKDYHLCLDCSFKQGKIAERKYLNLIGLGLDSFHAAVNPDGEVQVWWGRNATPPWERTVKQQRSSPQYQIWREAVFERDDYTCQTCGVRDGELNAHHVKRFADHPELRFDVDNGVTLCVQCHKQEHKRRHKGGLNVKCTNSQRIHSTKQKTPR